MSPAKKKAAKKKKKKKKAGSKAKKPKSTVIVIDDANNVADPAKAWCRPDGHVTFVIQNDYANSRFVRIPPDEFEEDPPEADKPEHPMVPLQVHWTSVAANEVGVIKLQVRGSGHFPKKGDFTYKYTIYWADDAFGTNERKKDPQIEINN
jgi:hypothetical protein